MFLAAVGAGYLLRIAWAQSVLQRWKPLTLRECGRKRWKVDLRGNRGRLKTFEGLEAQWWQSFQNVAVSLGPKRKEGTVDGRASKSGGGGAFPVLTVFFRCSPGLLSLYLTSNPLAFLGQMQVFQSC